MQFKLPELGEGVHEGELVKWRVQVGENVKYDQPLCEVMTDKATVEIPSAFQGKVGELHAKEGEVIHVGQLMLSFEGAAAPSASPASTASATLSPPVVAPAVAGVATPGPEKSGMAQPSGAVSAAFEAHRAEASIHNRVLAAPVTRRLAREMGVDLAQISGSGPHGRVMKEDLMSRSGSRASHSAAAPTAPLPLKRANGKTEERVPFRGLRKKISEKMRLSKDRAAHFTYVEEADATQLVALRNQSKEMAAKQGIKLTYLPFVMKAMVAALKEFPILNSTLDESSQEIVYKYEYNIGLSVQTEDGLTAPVVKDVANKSILQLAKEIQDLVERARTKKLTLDDLQGSTITLTNAGSIGGLFATPVINYPEVAILGFNKIFRKPVVKTVRHADGSKKEEIAIADWTYFSISLDHRIVDGAVGAEFMKLFIQFIENPSLLLLA